MSLTNEQKSALALDRPLSVIANAGSGKTRVLVERYLSILKSFIPSENRFLYNSHNSAVSSTIAITFTKKAAAEIQAKAVALLEKEIDDASSIDEREKLHRIRESISYSRISTIHSFCSRLLRDYPIEAGVSPSFVELSAVETTIITDDAISLALVEWFDSDDPFVIKKVQLLMQNFTRKELISTIKNILNKCGSINKLEKIYKNSFDVFINKRNYLIYQYCYNNINICINILNNIVNHINLNNINNVNEKKLYIENSSLFNTIKLYIDEIHDFHDIIIFDDFLQKLYEFVQYSKYMFTSDFSNVRSKFKCSIDIIELKNFEKMFKKNIIIIDEIAKSYIYNSYEEKEYELGQVIYEFAKYVYDIIELTKYKKDGLGFDDLILKASQVLDNEIVCAKVKKNIKYLLIDEFQDTDPIQYEIIKKLIPELNGSSELKIPDINLFIVGDTKQSIYGFRNADIRVFQQARKDIKSLNTKLINSGFIENNISNNVSNNIGDSYLSDLKLTATFRLMPIVALFVNTICSNIMIGNDNEYEVDYQQLICARNVNQILESNCIDKFDSNEINNKIGSAKILISIKNSSNPTNDVIEVENFDIIDEEISSNKEAEHVVNYINSIISGDAGVLVQGENGEFRSPKFKDIAILSRKKKSLYSLSKYLLKNNLPYSLYSSNSIFSNIELLDIVSILTFIVNPNDDYILFSILRSPLFSITDTQILIVNKYSNDLSLWIKLSKYCENIQVNNIDINGINYSLNSTLNNIIIVYNILKTILDSSFGRSLSDLITYILNKIRYWGKYTNKPDVYSIIADAEGLINYAREYETKAFCSLSDFIIDLTSLVEDENTDVLSGEINISSDDRINLMTIHLSKGLEFPIVILYDTNSSNISINNLIINDDIGLINNLIIKNIYDNAFKIETPSYKISKYICKSADIAEEKRNLYVALTRAKDHIIVSANLKTKNDGEFWSFKGLWNLIAESLNINDDAIKEKGNVTINNKLSMLKDYNVINNNILYSCEIILNINLINNINKANNLLYCKYLISTDYLSIYIYNEILSYTKIQLYNKSYSEYINNNILGLLNLNIGQESSNTSKIEISNNISGIQFGVIIHYVLENINKWFINGEIKQNIFETTILNTLKDNHIYNIKEYYNRIYNECENITLTKLIIDDYRNNYVYEVENEYYYPIENNIFIAITDLIILLNNNEYEIRDWKTNKLRSSEEMSEISKKYKLQMKYYSYLLLQKNKSQNTINARLLFTKLAKPNANNDDWIYTFTWTRDQLANVYQELLQYSENMIRLKE